MASRPATLRPRLIVPVITITVPLGALPDPSPATPTISVPAILLIANSRTRPECLAARGASPFLHRTSSPSQPERSSLPDQLTVQSLSPVRGDTIDAGQFTGSILVSTTGSILMSAKGQKMSAPKSLSSRTALKRRFLLASPPVATGARGWSARFNFPTIPTCRPRAAEPSDLQTSVERSKIAGSQKIALVRDADCRIRGPRQDAAKPWRNERTEAGPRRTSKAVAVRRCQPSSGREFVTRSST
jgi:hypothetical protein